MKPIERQEVLAFEQYERLRPRLRPLFIAEKNRRRLNIGEHLTLLFENDRTVWYQIHEMLRAERILDDAAIRHEMDTYNDLLPNRDELAATLLIAFEDAARRTVALRELVGLENHLWLDLDGDRRPAHFDPRQFSSERIASVHFIKFPVGGVGAAAWRAMAARNSLAIEINHPKLQARAPVEGGLAASLAEDLEES